MSMRDFMNSGGKEMLEATAFGAARNQYLGKPSVNLSKYEDQDIQLENSSQRDNKGGFFDDIWSNVNSFKSDLYSAWNLMQQRRMEGDRDAVQEDLFYDSR